MCIVLIKTDNFLIDINYLRPTGREIFWFECGFSEEFSLPLSVCAGRGGFDYCFYIVKQGFRGFWVLNVLKNSWNFAHGSEPAAIRAGLKLVPGRGRGARQRPLERDPNTCP